MAIRATWELFVLLAIAFCFVSTAHGQTAPSTTFAARNSTTSTTSRASAATSGAAPDVYLNVPELHVGRIELDVDNLTANLNLNAKVANLVQLNAGVQVAIQKVNLTISEVDAEVELVVRLGTYIRPANRFLDARLILIQATSRISLAVFSIPWTLIRYLSTPLAMLRVQSVVSLVTLLALWMVYLVQSQMVDRLSTSLLTIWATLCKRLAESAPLLATTQRT